MLERVRERTFQAVFLWCIRPSGLQLFLLADMLYFLAGMLHFAREKRRERTFPALFLWWP
jgi:hypothetical protein